MHELVRYTRDMPAVVVANAVQAVVRGTILGRQWVNVLGVRFGANGASGGVFVDQALATAIGSAVRAAWVTLQPTLTNQWTMQDVLIFDLQSATAPSWDAGITPLTGGSTTDPMPPHLAACCTHRTAFRGRSFRGRTYVAGLTESAQAAGGIILNSTRTAVETVFSTFRTELGTIGTADCRQAVISRTLADAFEVVGSQCDENWDHQDRRKTS